MPEAFNPHPLLRPGALYNAATIDDARDIVARMLATGDGDEIADLIEHAVDKSDRAHAVIFHLWLQCKGIDAPNAIELLR